MTILIEYGATYGHGVGRRGQQVDRETMGRQGLSIRVVATRGSRIAGCDYVGNSLCRSLLRQTRNTRGFCAGEVCLATAKALAHYVRQIIVDDV